MSKTYSQSSNYPYSLNKLSDQLVKTENGIFHFSKVFIVVKPGVERLLCVICLYTVSGEAFRFLSQDQVLRYLS